MVGLLGTCAGCAAVRPPSRSAYAEKILTTTGYCSCGSCCGWWRNWYFMPVDKATGKRKQVGQTASGTAARPGTIAAPPEYAYGTILHIPGYGYGRVEDRGGAIKGNHIDLFFNSHRQAQQWGNRKLKVKIWYPESKQKPAIKKSPGEKSSSGGGVGAKTR